MARKLVLAGASLVLMVIVGLCFAPSRPEIAPGSPEVTSTAADGPSVDSTAALAPVGVQTVASGSTGNADFNPFAPASQSAAKPVTMHRPLRKLSPGIGDNTGAAAAPTASAAPPAAAAPLPAGGVMTLADLIDTVERSVVKIKVFSAEGEGIGSGFVASPDGRLIVTNFHVIEGGIRAEVGFRDDVRAAVEGVRAYDVKRDLAVLQISTQPIARPPLPIVSVVPRKGETVVALGSPRGFSFTASDGIVSGIRDGQELREIVGPSYDNDVNMKFIQSTAPISPGNSGGPLVNNRGEVVGINTFAGNESQNLNFAVAAEHVKQILASAASAPLAPLSSLPRPKPAAVAGGPNGWEIRLPDGKIFSSAMCQIDRSQMKSLSGIAKPPAVVEYPSGRPKAIAWHSNGTLDGTAIMVFENGRPSYIGRYDEGKLDGNVIFVDDTGRAKLFAQYNKGRLDGFRCSFQSGRPSMLAQFSRDKLTAIHYLKQLQVVKSYKTAEEIGPADAEAQAASKAMTATLDEFAEADRSLRKSIREIDQEERQARASALSADRRKGGTPESRAAAVRAIYSALQNN